MSNTVEPDETAHYGIWICAICKSLLISPMAVKELKNLDASQSGPDREFEWSANKFLVNCANPDKPDSVQFVLCIHALKVTEYT